MPAGTASTSTIRVIFPDRFFLGASVKRSRREPAGQTSTSLPLPVEGRSYKQNQGKLWCLILAVVQAAYAAGRFGEGGARCFVEGFVWDAAMVSEAGAFLLDEGLQHHSQEHMLLRQIATYPKPERQLDGVTA